MSAMAQPEILNPAGFVPPSAVAFGALGSRAIPVTPANPLPVHDPLGQLSLIERLNREGDPAGFPAETEFSAFTAPTGAGTSFTGPLPTPAAGRAVFVQSLMISATTPIRGRIWVNNIAWSGLTANQGLMDIGFTAGPAYPAIVPVNAFVRSADKGSLGCYINRWLDPLVRAGITTATTVSGSPNLTDVAGAALVVGQVVTGTGIPTNTTVTAFDDGANTATLSANATANGSNVTISGQKYVLAGMSGFTLADSLNFEAEKALLFVGDSLWNGTGPSDITKFIPWRINAYFRDKGIDNRYILKAYSGMTTAGGEQLRKAGKFAFAGVAAVFYQLGTNDAVGAVATETSMANVTAFVVWAKARHPEAKIVVFGPPPLENNTAETAAAALRTAIDAYVDGLADPNVLFCTLGGSFDRAVSGNYVSSDTPGSRVHPDDDGLGFIWDGGYSGFAGVKAWLDANLATV